MDWIDFDETRGSLQRLPPERRKVLVQIERRRDAYGGGLPPTVAVGYLRFSGGDMERPIFIVPGVTGERVAWCDCLGDDFRAPLWKSTQAT